MEPAIFCQKQFASKRKHQTNAYITRFFSQRGIKVFCLIPFRATPTNLPGAPTTWSITNNMLSEIRTGGNQSTTQFLYDRNGNLEVAYYFVQKERDGHL